MTYKVSIIVPIYKVEKYLKRCVDSLLNQTYSNLEIILVDDGSPDNCGHIIDQYANYDSRIIALHKENGGLSDARNYGMKFATGVYTIFVDSDDWIDQDFISVLLDQSVTYQADIVQSGFFYTYQDYLLYDNRFYSENDPPLLLDNRTLMKELVINERVKNFAWGKLYKTDLIRDLPFKKGVLFEDVFWAHKVMQRVQNYVIFNRPLYFYVQREDSIVSTYTPKNLDILKGLKERHSFIVENYPHLANESQYILLRTHLNHYNLLLANYKKDHKNTYRKEIHAYLKENSALFKGSIENDKQLKWQYYLFNIHPYLNVLFLVLNRFMRMVRILPKPIGLKKIPLYSSNRGEQFNESVS